MRLKGKKVALLAENSYQEMELWAPYYRLKEEGADVKVVGAGGAKSYTSKHGYPVNVDVQAEDVSAKDFDGVVIPGGYAPDMMRRSKAMVQLVKDAFSAGKPVAAICHGPQVLISANTLRGRTLTCWPSIAIDVKNAGGLYVDKPVVEDGNLITSRKLDDVPVFSDAIIRALSRVQVP